MNIKDTKNISLPEGDMLENLYKFQKVLMEKYHKIEKENGLLLDESVPVDINSYRGQARIKDFLWRVTEELGEAMTATSEDHAKEEIADTLHFFLELLILSDIPHTRLRDNISKISKENYPFVIDSLRWIFECSPNSTFMTSEKCVTFVIIPLTQAGNCLKQKSWKQTPQLTDINKYRKFIYEAFMGFITMCKSYDLTSESLCKLYYSKHEVNQFRIRSKY